MRIHPPYIVIGVFAAAALLSAFVVAKTIEAQKNRSPDDVVAPKGLERLAPPGPPGPMTPPGVEDGAVAGKVTADGGKLPEGVAVFAQRSGGAKEAPRHVDVAPNGLYRIVLPEGDWRLWAGPGHAADVRAAPAFARVTRGSTATLDLVASTAPAGLVLQILEPDGQPSAGAVVTLGRPGDAKLALATAAGADGQVALAKEMGLGGAAAEVRAHNGGRTGAWTGTLPEAGAVTVKLSPAGALEGAVVAKGGKAPAGFVLTIASQPAPQAWRTLVEQRFTGDRFAVPDLPPEPLRLLVKTDDGRTGAIVVSPAAGATTSVEVPVGAR
jgi:hypothetical protein